MFDVVIAGPPTAPVVVYAKRAPIVFTAMISSMSTAIVMAKFAPVYDVSVSAFIVIKIIPVTAPSSVGILVDVVTRLADGTQTKYQYILNRNEKWACGGRGASTDIVMPAK